MDETKKWNARDVEHALDSSTEDPCLLFVVSVVFWRVGIKQRRLNVWRKEDMC